MSVLSKFTRVDLYLYGAHLALRLLLKPPTLTVRSSY